MKLSCCFAGGGSALQLPILAHNYDYTAPLRAVFTLTLTMSSCCSPTSCKGIIKTDSSYISAWRMYLLGRQRSETGSSGLGNSANSHLKPDERLTSLLLITLSLVTLHFIYSRINWAYYCQSSFDRGTSSYFPCGTKEGWLIEADCITPWKRAPFGCRIMRDLVMRPLFSGSALMCPELFCWKS